ncbi:MAG: alpha/beta hydrolase [Acidimicrobiales bacterium]
MSLTTYRITRDGAPRLLFLLHGYSAEQHHLASYVPLIDPDERFSAIAPRGPVPLPNGDTDGASWWSIDTETTQHDLSQFQASVDGLEALIADEAAAAKVPLERCYIGGFSQGGYLALTLVGKADAPRYGGVWAICCGLPEFAAVPVDLSTGDGRPALVQWGTRDLIVTTDQAEAVAASLEAGGWNTQVHAYDMAHSQTIEMMIDARAWLASID